MTGKQGGETGQEASAVLGIKLARTWVVLGEGQQEWGRRSKWIHSSFQKQGVGLKDGNLQGKSERRDQEGLLNDGQRTCLLR